jgi:hypothetical protein
VLGQAVAEQLQHSRQEVSGQALSALKPVQ